MRSFLSSIVWGGSSGQQRGTVPAAPRFPKEAQLRSAAVANEAELVGHDDRVWSVAWHPSGRILASCSGDRTVRLWTYTTDETRPAESQRKWHNFLTLSGEHTRTVRHVAWSPDGEVLACSSFDSTVTLWKRVQDVDDAEGESKSGGGGGGGGGVSLDKFELSVEGVLEGHEHEVKAVAWDSTGALLATCSRDKTVWIWERQSPTSVEFEIAATLTGHSQDVKYVTWHPVDRTLYSCGYDDVIKVWEEVGSGQDDWRCVCTASGHSGTVWQIAFDPYDVADSSRKQGSQKFASCSSDGSVILWERSGEVAKVVCKIEDIPDSTPRPMKTEGLSDDENDEDDDIQAAENIVYTVAWSPLSGLLAKAGDDDSVELYRYASTKEGATTTKTTSSGSEVSSQLEFVAAADLCHAADVNAVAWSPMEVGPIGSQRQVSGASSEAQSTTSVCLLATASDDGTVKIWRVSCSC